MSLSAAIEKETHLAYMSRMGLYPENLARHEARLVELRSELERQRQEYLQVTAILERMTAPKLKELTCLRPMGADEYFNGRGGLCEEKPSPFHH